MQPGAEMGQLIAGPFAAKMLGDFGADGIKIEAPGASDPLRNWRLMQDGTSVWWQVQSRNKRSIALDLRSPQGQDIAKKLIAQADVLIENFRRGTLEGSRAACRCAAASRSATRSRRCTARSACSPRSITARSTAARGR